MNNDLNAQTSNYEDSLTEDGRYRLLIESIRDYAIFMLDREGCVANWNAGAERFKGYKSSEIVGVHFSAFYTDEDKAVDLPRRALETAERYGIFETEGWRLRKDGSRFWAHVVIDPIRDKQGKLVGYAKITRDLTEKYEAKIALERAREELFQSQKTEAIGRLTGGVAHDFNNLLAAIVGNLELLRKRATEPKLIAFVDNALAAAKRGTTLTHRMLTFARKSELNTERVDVIQLIHGMTELLKSSIGAENVLETHFPVGLPPVLIDPDQLENALINLIVNAKDAIPIGGTIVIGGRVVDEGRKIAISVRDNGEGMDAETLRRAAEPFFTTKGVGKGTGLGLSTVQGMVEQSGGTMKIDSKKGVGTTVELILPAAPDEKTREVPASVEDNVSGPTNRLTILAVDDDSLVLMGTEAMLEDLGHTVVAVGSGAEALDVLRSRADIEILITDQAMPKMTGLTLAQEAKALRPDLMIIIATGYADLPPNDLPVTRLAKPFLQNDLQAAIVKAKAAMPEMK